MNNWMFMLERLVAVIPLLEKSFSTRRELRDSALRSLSHAIRETKIYYNRNLDLDRGARDRDIEAQLVRYWAAAAIPLRHVDPQLAEICEHKSDYWLDPQDWTKDDVARFRIGLNGVDESYRRLLLPKRGFSRGNPRNTPVLELDEPT
jgi:hypothetical protein